MIIVMFGAPGVGKGTQAALLAERKGIHHLSTGEAFRSAIAAGTELGKTAQEFVQSGGLVPDEIVTGIVEEAMAKPEFLRGQYWMVSLVRLAKLKHWICYSMLKARQLLISLISQSIMKRLSKECFFVADKMTMKMSLDIDFMCTMSKQLHC